MKLSISLVAPAIAALLFSLSACSSDDGAPLATTPGIGAGGAANTGGGSSTGGAADVVVDPATIAGKYAEYFPIGVAIEPAHLSTVGDIVSREFNHITAENAMKPQSVQPTEGSFNFTGADALADYARAQGVKMTGHTLLWHRQAPAWFFADLEAGNAEDIETLKSRLKTHIETMVDRYADVVSNWDVVNEAVSDGEGYRSGTEGSKWYEIFGSEEYVSWAFKYAYDALEAKEPGSAAGKLYYNDYNATLKIDRMIALCDAVRAKGIPVDGIGFQAHLRMDWPSTGEIKMAIDKVIAAGYKVKISELDVTLYNDYPTGTLDPAPEIVFTAEVEAAQAQRYAELFELFRSYKGEMTSVTLWGVSDNATWLDNEPVPGRDNHPLLFNDEYMPKAAVEAIKNF